jgi:hypothetical protein
MSQQEFTPGQQVRERGTGRTCTISAVFTTRTADGRTVHALIVDDAVRPPRDFELPADPYTVEGKP